MKHDQSYGIVPLRWHQKGWQVLLVKHQAGHWAFPKGHVDPGESAQQAAIRELEEETGLSIESFLSEKSFQERYRYSLGKETIDKTVTYYLAKVSGTPRPQRKEIAECSWISLSDAVGKITFEEAKQLCRQVLQEMDYIKPT